MRDPIITPFPEGFQHYRIAALKPLEKLITVHMNNNLSSRSLIEMSFP